MGRLMMLGRLLPAQPSHCACALRAVACVFCPNVMRLMWLGVQGDLGSSFKCRCTWGEIGFLELSWKSGYDLMDYLLHVRRFWVDSGDRFLLECCVERIWESGIARDCFCGVWETGHYFRISSNFATFARINQVCFKLNPLVFWLSFVYQNRLSKGTYA